MKALTVKEPWASLIINGYKKYEFRTWKTNYRGKLFIHAGMSLEKEMEKKVKDYNLDYQKGAVIGEVTLVDCILVDEKMDQILRKIDPVIYENDHIGVYAWKLENVQKYKNPIPIKGKLGLWNFKEIEESKK